MSVTRIYLILPAWLRLHKHLDVVVSVISVGYHARAVKYLGTLLGAAHVSKYTTRPRMVLLSRAIPCLQKDDRELLN